MNTKTISRFFGLFTSVLLLLATTMVCAQTREEFSSLVLLDQSKVNPNVIKSFEQKFKSATILSWYQAKENNLLVKYNHNDQTQYAVFSSKGTLIRQFTYCLLYTSPSPRDS